MILTTHVVPISAESPAEDLIARASTVLRQEGLVAFPTETVYGLGADAMSPAAVKKVFAAKGRPGDNPLIVHIAAIDQLFDLGTDISSTAKKLAETFWPGPLTLVVKRKSSVPDIVTAGLDTVAVRVPNHPVPVALVRHLARGIVGPSANVSGGPSPTTAQHVYADLNGKIEMILDAGPTTIGVESTVVDTTATPPAILRLGGLTRDRIESVIGAVQTSVDSRTVRRSPGTRYRHYAPKASVELIEIGNSAQFADRIRRHQQNGTTIGCIIHSPLLASVKKDDCVLVLSANIDEYARELFSAMRRLDLMGVTVMLIEEVKEAGLGITVMDRLRRAARINDQ